VVALAMIYVGGKLGEAVPSLKFFAPMQFKLDVAWSVAPVTLVFIGMVVFNNLCLKYVEVSFYQVARSLSVVFSVIMTYFYFGQKTSSRALACCGVIVFGFAIGSWGEVNFSFIGSVFGVISSLFVAAYGIAVKKALNVLNNDNDVLLIYNTILSIILMAPIILISGEVQVMMEDPVLQTGSAWVELTIAGVFGLLINIATYLQISLTSALTHNISGTAKATLQSILGVLIYRNPINAVGIIGIAAVLAGSFLYTYVRKLEMDAKDAQQAPPTK
jgi:solute carrier family 35 (GDP-fucose transporter), member C1